MTTVLLNIHNAGFFELNSMILAMGIFYGGLAQVIAGVIEAKKNNTFRAYRIYIVWLFLAVIGRTYSDAKIRLGTSSI
jgi:succinate-acetate transporter protein